MICQTPPTCCIFFCLLMTQIFFLGGKNIESMIDVLNNELVKISEWLNVNRLSLNISKTQYIIFSMSNQAPPKSMFLLMVKM